MYNYITNQAREQGLFSLHYGKTFIKNPIPDEIKTEELPDRTRYVKSYLFGGALSVVETTDILSRFRTVETKLKIKNVSGKNTERIKALKTLDCVFPTEKNFVSGFPCDNDYAKIVWYKGYARVEEKFCPHDVYLTNGDVHSFAPVQARSCDEVMAYFDIIRKNVGAVLCVGWTGQWQADFFLADGGVGVQLGMQVCDFILKKDEEYDYVSASAYFYDDGFLNGHNGFRKYMKTLTPMGTGSRSKLPPICTGTCGGMAEWKHLELIGMFSGLGTDVYWMDSGWFGHLPLEGAEGSSQWYEHVGNWNINKTAHPSEFGKIKAACEKAGLKPLLWFELERAMEDSDEYKKHPEWFLGRNDADPSNNQYLLNLGIAEARDYFFGIFSDVAEKSGLKWYRPDFNVDALPYMRNNDCDGRRGITELGYINGLYAFLDRILQTYPDMMIDNCAGGGNRMDIEMQKRTMTLWRSDYNCWFDYAKEGIQAATLGSSLLFPYYGGGCRVSSESLYDIRASYAAAIDFNLTDVEFVSLWKDYDKYPKERATIEFVRHIIPFFKKVLEEYKEVRHLYSENFAPHSAYNSDPYSWCAYEFYNDEKSDCVLQVFRRRLSEQNCADYKIVGVDENYDYTVRDMDGNTVEMSGRELKEGLHVEIPRQSESRIYHIKRK